jgi:hypothetical protein
MGYLSLALLAVVGASLFVIFSMLLQGTLTPADFSGLALVCPLVLILALGLVLSRLKGFYESRKEAAKVKAADAGTKARKRSETIREAEINRDIWSMIVQLKGENTGDRIAAVRGLRSHDTPDVEAELTKAMLEDPDADVRFEAYLALKFRGKDTMGFLLERLKAEGDTKKKLGLLELLRKTVDERQVGTLTYLYNFETDKSVKLGILDSLDKFNSSNIKDLLIFILRSEDDKDVRLKALEMLNRYDDASTRDPF